MGVRRPDDDCVIKLRTAVVFWTNSDLCKKKTRSYILLIIIA